jgi:hypothetical protein
MTLDKLKSFSKIAAQSNLASTFSQYIGFKIQ